MKLVSRLFWPWGKELAFLFPYMVLWRRNVCKLDNYEIRSRQCRKMVRLDHRLEEIGNWKGSADNWVQSCWRWVYWQSCKFQTFGVKCSIVGTWFDPFLGLGAKGVPCCSTLKAARLAATRRVCSTFPNMDGWGWELALDNSADRRDVVYPGRRSEYAKLWNMAWLRTLCGAQTAIACQLCDCMVWFQQWVHSWPVVLWGGDTSRSYKVFHYECTLQSTPFTTCDSCPARAKMFRDHHLYVRWSIPACWAKSKGTAPWKLWRWPCHL